MPWSHMPYDQHFCGDNFSVIMYLLKKPTSCLSARLTTTRPCSGSGQRGRRPSSVSSPNYAPRSVSLRTRSRWSKPSSRSTPQRAPGGMRTTRRRNPVAAAGTIKTRKVICRYEIYCSWLKESKRLNLLWGIALKTMATFRTMSIWVKSQKNVWSWPVEMTRNFAVHCKFFFQSKLNL